MSTWAGDKEAGKKGDAQRRGKKMEVSGKNDGGGTGKKWGLYIGRDEDGEIGKNNELEEWEPIMSPICREHCRLFGPEEGPL